MTWNEFMADYSRMGDLKANIRRLKGTSSLTADLTTVEDDSETGRAIKEEADMEAKINEFKNQVAQGKIRGPRMSAEEMAVLQKQISDLQSDIYRLQRGMGTSTGADTQIETDQFELEPLQLELQHANKL